MNIRKAKWWSRALRSGEYKQCWNVLRESDRKGVYAYCVLGVLQALAESSSAFHGSIDWDSACLSPDVMEWAGLHNNFALYAKDEYLSAHSDNGMKFPKLATIIDRNIETL